MDLEEAYDYTFEERMMDLEYNKMYVPGVGRKSKIPIDDLSGTRFSKLKVDKFEYMRAYPSGSRKSFWSCSCDCGNKIIVSANQLKSGSTRSCGCLHKETSKQNSINSRHKIIKHDASLRSLYSVYKSNAKKVKRKFDLTLDEFEHITSDLCFYCGIPPHREHKAHKNAIEYKYNGVDRLDNTKGYFIENVVPACSMCNHAKSNHDKDYFINWIKQAAKHLEVNYEPRFDQNPDNSVTNLVIEDLKNREVLGYRGYGRFLTEDSPENMMKELYNEIQDGMLYLKTEILKRDMK